MLWQNIIAVVLVLILAAQSAQLFHGVIYKKFSVEETWDKFGINIIYTNPLLYYVGSIFY